MNNPDLVLFWIAFFAYLAGFLLYSLFLAQRSGLTAKLGMSAMALGFAAQTAGFIVRWSLAEHVPLSNMYEYLGLMSWMAVLTLFIIVGKNGNHAFGGFIAPLVFMLMVTASLLPKDISQALMPALQSYWITIHVTLAALGSGAFAVACAVSLVYLLKKSSANSGGLFQSPGSWQTGIISILIFPPVIAILSRLTGFIPADSGFILNLGGTKLAGLGWFFAGAGLALPFGGILWNRLYWIKISPKSNPGSGAGIFVVSIVAFLIASLICGLLIKWRVVQLTGGSAWRVFEFFGAAWLLSILVFFPVNWILGIKGLAYFRRANLNIENLDELNYKTVCFGYPLYMVGALFAGAIWAEQAWGQFWSWDPKEVGALIIWLFYTGFLHARRHPAWRGERAAVLSVLGLMMILLSFFGNYFFGGQHAYI